MQNTLIEVSGVFLNFSEKSPLEDYREILYAHYRSYTNWSGYRVTIYNIFKEKISKVFVEWHNRFGDIPAPQYSENKAPVKNFEELFKWLENLHKSL